MPSSCIRDSSRNQLHRLGALYSNPQDLSSPVHRTETAFAIDQDNETRSNAKLKKSNKLAELANSYNQWEDETATRARANKANGNNHTNGTAPSTSKTGDAKIVSGIKSTSKSPRKFGETGGISSILARSESTETNENKNSPNKQLKWDKRIMDSLESQGYKRRDTTTKRLEYDFIEQPDGKETDAKVSNVMKPSSGPSTGAVSKVFTAKNETASKPEPASSKKVEVTRGLVSGRAAIFESSAPRTTSNAASASKNQKDPAEMSLKERLAMFEKNKGEALIPKAALGMAPSAKQINADKKQTENIKQVITTPQQPMVNGNTAPSVAPSSSKINNFNRAVKADTAASGTGIRQTVAALLSAPATIAESRIANESRKIREQEMNVVINRFNQKAGESSPAPPAPPMPDNLFKSSTSGGKKRLSGNYLNFFNFRLFF